MLLLASAAHAAQLYRCSMDGAVRTSCCCPPDEPNPQPTLKDACCCTIEHVQPVKAPTTTSPRHDQTLSLPAMVAAPLFAVLPAPRPMLLHPTEARSRVGPLILELKNSRLI